MILPARWISFLALLACVVVCRESNADESSPTFATPPSFQQDIIPILTRYGCNQGACHGKLAGQNGFRLSLRGYAPDWDHDSLTREFFGRRINRANPAESLLLKKASGQIPHGGGSLFESGSPAWQALCDWIAAGTPGILADEPTVARLAVQAIPQVAREDNAYRPGETAQVRVQATYTDGRERDVTWLAQFYANDPSVLEVSSSGLVKCLRAGESVVRVHFKGQVAVATLTIPFEQEIDAAQFVERRNLIDEHVFNKLAALRIPPSPPASDATFLRRAYLDTIGTLPTPEEATAFLADTSTEKRSRVIEQLLERPEFVDYWTLQLCDLLQNRKERDHDVRGTKGVRSMQAWVREQVAQNRPWNEVARDVLTATGDSVAQPQVGYYIVTIGEHRKPEESEVIASVAQAFLGTRIGCAKCHNHPLERYTQDDYYHFAAFFSRVQFKRQDSAKGPTTLLISSEEEQRSQRQIEQTEKKLAELQASLAGKEAAEAEQVQKQIENQNKQLENHRKQLADSKTRPPMVRQPRTGQQLAPQALDQVALNIPEGEDPRQALARWIIDPQNESFAGNMVNRLWRHFFAVGLVEPVDDLRASNPPSNRELFAALVQEFVGRNYDLKQMMRLILNSRAYQLSSATLAQNELEQGFYSHYYARRLPAEVMLDAVSQSTQVPDQFPGYPLGMRAIQLPDSGVASPFLSLFGRSDRVTACACERSGDVTLPQLLHLQCGDGLSQKFDNGDGRLKSILKESLPDPAAIDAIFLAALSRRPTEQELATIAPALAESENREEALRDLFWAVLNTKEFAFNH